MHNASEQVPKKPVLPVSRIVVIVFVIVAAIVIVLEVRVRSQWNATYQAIAAEIEQEAPVSKKDVDQYIKGSPRRESPDKNQEVFIWSGLLRKYRMRLRYSGDMVVGIDSQNVAE